MTYTARWIKAVLIAVLTVGVAMSVAQAHAADLPLAAASPLTGVAFDDKPLLLPVQRNFQMALLTSSSELGRSCGKMEAYGWRMSQSEQGRVNQIFNNTVDRLRLMGYKISPQTLSSVSKDITLYTADRPDKHFLFLWSAGDLGLVLNLCQTTAPTGSHAMELTPSVQVFPILTNDVVTSDIEAVRAKSTANFTPIGSWNGSYSCKQGYTAATLKINSLHGKDFEGEFSFYPSSRNLLITKGGYTVYGQYDSDSKRILINPGKWIHRPPHYFNTVIVGSFDPVKDTFSAYFQGVNGCTSFEAGRAGESRGMQKATTSHKKHTAKKKAVKKAKPQTVSDTNGLPPGIDLAPAAVAPAPVSPAPVSPAPVSPALPIAPTTPTATLPAIAVPAPVIPAAPQPAPAALLPPVQAPVTAAPASSNAAPMPAPAPVEHASPLPVMPPSMSK